MDLLIGWGGGGWIYQELSFHIGWDLYCSRKPGLIQQICQDVRYLSHIAINVWFR